MTKEQYFEFAEKFFADCVEISRRKNNDYTGGDSNPFSNFQSVEVLGIKTEAGFLTRMFDKIKRLSSFVQTENLQVKEESVTDTLKDLANYCCLLAGYLESKKELNQDASIGKKTILNWDETKEFLNRLPKL